MRISRQTWKNYAKQLNDINSKAAEELFQWIEAYGVDENGLILDNITEAIDKFNNSFIDECNFIVKKYGDASGALSATMYDAIASIEGASVDAAEIAEAVPISDIYKTVNGVLKTSHNPDEMTGAVSRLVKRVGADTMLQNAKRDGAEFAWIPIGDTCAFCIALASRGWQKVGKNTLKNGHAEHIHSNCDCNYAVRFDGKSNVEGYDPDKYLEMYNSADGANSREKINSLRKLFQSKFGTANDSIDISQALFEKATDRKSAYKLINEVFGSISDNVNALDEDLLVDNVNRLMELNMRFKVLDSNNLGFFTASPSSNSIAWTSTKYVKEDARTNLSLVGKWYKKPEVLVAEEEAARDKFFSMPSKKEYNRTYTVTHEYGHIVESFVSRRRTDWSALEAKKAKMVMPSDAQLRGVYKLEEQRQAEIIFDEIKSIAKANNPNFSMKDNLSKYGHKDYYEFFAECFANSQCGEPNELGVAMNEWLRKEGF